MEVIKQKNGEEIDCTLLEPYGGRFSFREKIQLRGTGAPGIIYREGLEEFDWVKEVASDLDTANIEILRQGLVIRFRKRNRSVVCLVHQSEIEEINLNLQRLSAGFLMGQKSRDEGYLELYLKDTRLKFFIRISVLDRIEKFLRKDWVKGYLKTTRNGLNLT